MSRPIGCGLCVLCCAAFLVSLACAQPVPVPACSPESPFFCMDAAAFLEEESPVLEVYLEVCNDALQFVKAGQGYTASAGVTVVFFDKSGKQVSGDTYRVALTSARYSETTSVDSCKTRTISFDVAPGEYLVAVSVMDRDSKRKSGIQASCKVADFSGSPSLSDIAFIAPGDGTESSRWPGFRPNVRRSYGDIAEGVRFYYEMYNAVGEDSLPVTYTVFNGDGTPVLSDTNLVASGAREGLYGRVPLDTLSNGQYMLEIALLGEGGEKDASRSASFEVNREEFYLGRDVKDAVALLAYIATSSFIDSFTKADIEERRRMWEQFWREKDPTPATPRNEFYEEHVRRFRYAEKNFTAGLTEGWRTDRGRIYITEGPPDEVDSYSMEIDRYPTEVWFYFRNGRRYTFVDETGFGDYVLVSIQ
jgi:GWxTD domain-containing protein